MTVLDFHTAPPGRESLGRTLPQGFTLGYFRLFPPGRIALNASLFLLLELLVMQHGIKTVQAIPCFRGHQLVYSGQDLCALCFCLSLSHFQIALPPLFHHFFIEFPQVSQYPDHADEFVRHVLP